VPVMWSRELRWCAGMQHTYAFMYHAKRCLKRDFVHGGWWHERKHSRVCL